MIPPIAVIVDSGGRARKRSRSSTRKRGDSSWASASSAARNRRARTAAGISTRRPKHRQPRLEHRSAGIVLDINCARSAAAATDRERAAAADTEPTNAIRLAIRMYGRGACGARAAAWSPAKSSAPPAMPPMKESEDQPADPGGAVKNVSGKIELARGRPAFDATRDAVRAQGERADGGHQHNVDSSEPRAPDFATASSAHGEVRIPRAHRPEKTS